MNIIQSTDLESRGLLNDQSSALNIQGKWFKPGPAFTKSLLQTAMEFCEEARVQGKQYLLIEFPTYFMTWRRFRPKKSTQPKGGNDSRPKQPTPHSAHPRSTTQPRETSDHKLPKSVDPEFINRCRAELAIHIGPMADLLTEQIFAQSGQITPQLFVEALAEHISDPKAAHAFRLRLL
ncbi:hypothetical protein [Acaryochloris sp. IP29b_bin.137]|uniref:hypothetical protein n=1 Tax=Acaryochloris sp. IP29b_bin.137 TaxID=2969217 RepID=UPI002618DA68|nr:hypothetical protein [Acaryochloris sp. IP29b_bin.137]